MQLLKNPRYHIYTVLGFLFYVLCSLSLSKITYTLERGMKESTPYLIYFIVEGVICGLVAYLFSNIILYFLEKLIVFNDLKKKSMLKLLLVFVLVLVAYTFLVWFPLDMAYASLFDKPADITFFMMAVNLPYFSSIYILWLFIVIAVMVYRHINQVRINQLQLEASLRESQLNTLKGQINPHFMFNSLNNIRGLILEDATRARDMITRLSEMLRYSLTKNGINTIPLKEEIQTVENYIEISRIQFEERLNFSMDVDADAMHIGIPPMVVQMLVENAVKHGIGNIKDGGEVRLKIALSGQDLIIVVENSGSLSISEGTTKLGLENIRQRLHLLYGDIAKFTLGENNNFVEAKIIIPLQ